jgi:hypothetical protein
MPLEKLEQQLIALAREGKVPCAALLKLAQDFKVAPSVLGGLANKNKIKVSQCQLGCFK